MASENDSNIVDFIKLRPKFLKITRNPSLNRLDRSDLKSIARSLDISLDSVNMTLYEIYPQAFEAFEEKIMLSQYGNVSTEYEGSIDELYQIADNVKNGAPFNVRLALESGMILTMVPMSSIVTQMIIEKHKYKLPIKANLFDLSINKKILTRNNRFISLFASEIKRHLAGTYDLNDFDVVAYYLLGNLPSIKNNFYWKCTDEKNLIAHADNIGMCIPLFIVDPLDYFYSNLHCYSDIAPDSEYIFRLPDSNIIQKCKVYFAYRSRQDILTAYNFLHTNTGRIIFTPINRLVLERSSNSCNTLMEDFDELYKQGERIICLGNLNKFQSMTLDELIHLWKSNISNGYFFRNYPFDLDNIMTEAEFDDMILILRSYREQDRINILNELSQTMIDNHIKLIQDEDKLIQKFKSFKRERKDRIENVLHLLFETGMYFRGWKGPGKSYPIKSKSTTPSNVDPMVNATPHLNSIHDALMKDSWIGNIRIVNVMEGGYYDSGDSFSRYFRHVYTGDVCIRMASTKFIATAERTLKLLFGKSIPNFKSEVVEMIS